MHAILISKVQFHSVDWFNKLSFIYKFLSNLEMLKKSLPSLHNWGGKTSLIRFQQYGSCTRQLLN